MKKMKKIITVVIICLLVSIPSVWAELADNNDSNRIRLRRTSLSKMVSKIRYSGRRRNNVFSLKRAVELFCSG